MAAMHDQALRGHLISNVTKDAAAFKEFCSPGHENSCYLLVSRSLVIFVISDVLGRDDPVGSAHHP
jgi:hypothetical protein